MIMTEQHHHSSERDDEALPDGATATEQPTLLDRMGGPLGFVYSTVPVIVFVTANAFLSLPMTIGISITVGLALTGFRWLRGKRFDSAIGGLAGLAVAAGIVAWTGSAKDFFVIGIRAALAGFVVTFGSVLARRRRPGPAGTEPQPFDGGDRGLGTGHGLLRIGPEGR